VRQPGGSGRELVRFLELVAGQCCGHAWPSALPGGVCCFLVAWHASESGCTWPSWALHERVPAASIIAWIVLASPQAVTSNATRPARSSVFGWGPGSRRGSNGVKHTTYCRHG
jgi:hypothetical protein